MTTSISNLAFDNTFDPILGTIWQANKNLKNGTPAISWHVFGGGSLLTPSGWWGGARRSIALQFSIVTLSFFVTFIHCFEDLFSLGLSVSRSRHSLAVYPARWLTLAAPATTVLDHLSSLRLGHFNLDFWQRREYGKVSYVYLSIYSPVIKCCSLSMHPSFHRNTNEWTDVHLNTKMNGWVESHTSRWV